MATGLLISRRIEFLATFAINVQVRIGNLLFHRLIQHSVSPHIKLNFKVKIPYHNAEVMQSLAWKEALRAIVLVRRQDFTCKFSSFIWKSSEVERETCQVV